MKKTREPTFVSRIADEPPAPGTMSFTITVPAAVPSLFHSSLPCAPSSAAKNSVLSTSTSPVPV
jgi:hypothetical protein